MHGEAARDDAEARWFEMFREGDRRAWDTYAGEREAFHWYARGEAPRDEAEARWFETFRQDKRQAPEGYWDEREAFHRYARGEAPRDEADRQRFARFEQELAEQHGAEREQTDTLDPDHTGPSGELAEHDDDAGTAQQAGTYKMGEASAEPDPPVTGAQREQIRQDFAAGAPDPDIYNAEEMAIWRAAQIQARRQKEALNWWESRGGVPRDVWASEHADLSDQRRAAVHEPWAADHQQRPEDSGTDRVEQEARQQWLAGGAARDEDEALWFEQFGEEDGSDRSASELGYIAEHYRAEREMRTAARARSGRESADGEKAEREASDREEQEPWSEAEKAASTRLREAVTHAEQARAAYAAAQAAEGAAPDGSIAQADAQAATLAAKEAQFYADLEVTDSREKFQWLRRAYSAPPIWLGEASPAEPEQAGSAPQTPQGPAHRVPSRDSAAASQPSQLAARHREPTAPSPPGRQSAHAAENSHRQGQANPEADIEAGS